MYFQVYNFNSNTPPGSFRMRNDSAVALRFTVLSNCKYVINEGYMSLTTSKMNLKR